ncbi:MAG TPA: MFS transporter [Opitutaceae bacterium]|jgi:MFS family permease|nr:MFS transporter [Opitutaceae bacterium]
MINAKRLFLGSQVALIVTAMSFAIRGGSAATWAIQFHLNNEELGQVLGAALSGFTLAMLFGGPLCDLIGMRRIVAFAFVGHLVGILLTIFAWNFWSLFFGNLIFGVANGSVEAACNPLITALFPDDKTTKLNRFHMWFPGGIVIGAVLSYFMSKAGFSWKVEFATMLVPLVAYGFIFTGLSFPTTERVQKGISTGSMWAGCFNPLFLLMVACMVLTATTELGTGSWITTILTSAGFSGILVLAWINGVMAVGRMSAGAFVHKLSPIGMLLLSCFLSAIGLYAMSKSSGAMVYVAATIFAGGVCFFWPTMLGYTNDRFPKTGALGLAIMGGAGMLGAGASAPIIGKFFDNGIAHRLTNGQTVDALSSAPDGTPLAKTWLSIQADAGLEALGKVAVLPVILFFVFLILFLTRPKAKTS